jgi:glucose/mannose-6-phosphate isomerase
MNLDDLDFFKKTDTQNMLAQIDGLPDQLGQAWDLAQTLPLPDFKDIQNIVISAMGDSAIAAELAAAAVSSSIRLPVTLHRGYDLPAFASGKQTLVICISHSGNSEEVLTAFDQANTNGCSVLVISTGGEITKRASEKNIPVWQFSYAGTDTMGLAYPFRIHY